MLEVPGGERARSPWGSPLGVRKQRSGGAGAGHMTKLTSGEGGHCCHSARPLGAFADRWAFHRAVSPCKRGLVTLAL